MRNYTDNDRLKALLVREENRLSCRMEYPLERKFGRIIRDYNGIELIVTLDPIPGIRCDQWLATFPDNIQIISGINGIDAECRKRMPPLMSIYNL